MDPIETAGLTLFSVSLLVYLQDRASNRQHRRARGLFIAAMGLQLAAAALLVLPPDAHSRLFATVACFFTITAGVCGLAGVCGRPIRKALAPTA